MYLLMVVSLMLVLPVASAVLEYAVSAGTDLWLLVGKWFAFWAVGLRLLLAGGRQVAKPEFTARTIFESDAPETQTVVQELGFANLAIGMIGVLGPFLPGFILPAAIAGGLFYGLAGLKHVLNRDKNRLETIATVSDLFVFAVMAVFVIERIATGSA